MVRVLLLILIGSPFFLNGCAYDYSKLNGRSGEVDSGSSGAPGTGGKRAAGSGGMIQASGGQTVSGTGGTSGPGTGGLPAGTGGSGGGIAAGGAIGTGGQSTTNTGGQGTAGVGGQGTAGATGTGGGVVMSQILSIDFIGGYTVTSTAGASGSAGAGGTAGAGGGGGGSTTVTTVVSLPAMGSTEVAGVKAASHWNGASGAMGTLSALVLSDGSATAATVTWNSPKNSSSPGIWRLGYADAAGDVRMMNGYLDPLTVAMPATVTVTDLPGAIAAAGYDVYVYVTGQVTSGSRIYRYAIGATTSTVSQVAPSGTTFSGYTLAPEAGAGNYIVFRNLAGTSFTLTATPGGGSQNRAPVNGIQIVSPAGM